MRRDGFREKQFIDILLHGLQSNIGSGFIQFEIGVRL